ncbi:MAG: hypothetical protein U0X73_13275 [Thermoanaerobaculia bacterium]
MRKLEKLWIGVILVAALPKPAYAYIDPGTGSMILQGLIAALAALALTIRLWWHRLMVLLGLRQKTAPESNAPEDPGGPGAGGN